MVTGSWLKLLRPSKQDWQDGKNVSGPPERFLAEFRQYGSTVPIFLVQSKTRRLRLPVYLSTMEWDSLLPYPALSFADWWNEPIGIERSEKRCAEGRETWGGRPRGSVRR